MKTQIGLFAAGATLLLAACAQDMAPVAATPPAAADQTMATALAAGGRTLPGAEVKAMFIGNTSYWEAGTAKGFDYVAADGAEITSITQNGATNVAKGTAAVTGDKICYGTNCMAVVWLDGRYKLYADNGDLRRTVTKFTAGNAENAK